jgi:putative tryptophan/tyrosine transport system substrate-binding protein
MKRRAFFTGAAAWPAAARAQQSGPVRRIGVLTNGAATEAAPQSYVAAFLQASQQLGWTEGQNLRGDAALGGIYAAF